MRYLTIRADQLSDRARAVLEAGDRIPDDVLDELERVGCVPVVDPEGYLAACGVEGWYLDDDGHSHHIPEPDPRLHEIASVLYSLGDFAHGGCLVGTSRSWLESGEADRVQEWLEAGVFDAQSAARLAALGVTPSDVDVSYELSGQRNTIGYWVANRDISPEDARDLVKGPITVVGFGDDDWTDEEERPWACYRPVVVRLGRLEYEVAVAIGVEPALRATAMAGGGDVTDPAYATAWYTDPADWTEARLIGHRLPIPTSRADEVLFAIQKEAGRLWAEHRRVLSSDGEA